MSPSKRGCKVHRQGSENHAIGLLRLLMLSLLRPKFKTQETSHERSCVQSKLDDILRCRCERRRSLTWWIGGRSRYFSRQISSDSKPSGNLIKRQKWVTCQRLRVYFVFSNMSSPDTAARLWAPLLTNPGFVFLSFRRLSSNFYLILAVMYMVNWQWFVCMHSTVKVYSSEMVELSVL